METPTDRCARTTRPADEGGVPGLAEHGNGWPVAIGPTTRPGPKSQMMSRACYLIVGPVMDRLRSLPKQSLTCRPAALATECPR